jgi:hypothetical protein
MMSLIFLAAFASPNLYASTDWPCDTNPKNLQLITTCDELENAKLEQGTTGEAVNVHLKMFKVPGQAMYCIFGKEEMKGLTGGWEGTPLNTVQIDRIHTLKRTLVENDSQIIAVISGHGVPADESKSRPEKYNEWAYDKTNKTLSHIEWQSDHAVPFPNLAKSYRLKCVSPTEQVNQ